MDQVHHRWHAEVAKEQHFFEEEGIRKFEIITTNHNDDNLGIALMEGRVQFGLDARPQSVFRWVTQKNAGIVLIGGYKNQFHMAVLGAKGLTSLLDLKDKRIGVSTGKSDKRVSLDAAQARIMLKSAGLDPDKDIIWVSGVQFHPVLGDPIAALKRGEAESVFVWDTEVPKLQAEGYPVLFRFKDYYANGYPDRALVSTGAFINKHPETVKAFLKAMIRAYRFVRDMPRNYHYMVSLNRRMRAEHGDPEESTHSEVTVEKLASGPHPPDGRLPVKGLEAILNQEKEVGNIPKSLKMDRIVRLEFVEQANQELDKRDDLREELERVQKWVTKYGF